MKVSWKWLSEFVSLKSFKGPSELAHFLTQRGFEVESWQDLAQGLELVITAQVASLKPHPNADRLQLCEVKIGTSGKPLDIVCGARNMKVGDKVALAQVGAQLPNGVKIQKSQIRGSTSEGMLCSETELGFSKEGEGIIILPPETPLGVPLADALGREDAIFEVSVTPNRGDCLSHLGIAREIAAGTNQKIRMPKIPKVTLKGSSIKTSLHAKQDATQFLGVLIEGVQIAPSPEWLRQRLEALGNRSINNVVDASNWVLMELGHPMHTYDADRLEGNELSVRTAQKGESLLLLDQQKITLKGFELVIADRKRPVALAGVMGGGETEVSDKTTRIFIECAEFSSLLVRKAASAHQRHTEAAQRFERGVDPEGLQDALSRLTQIILQVAGGKVVGGVATVQKEKPLKPISVDPAYFSRFLGVEIAPARAKKELEKLGCKVQGTGRSWKVQPPSFRKDLKIPQDLCEEIARGMGYDQIPSTLPSVSRLSRSPWASALALKFDLVEKARDALASEGLHEAIGYSFTSQAWLKKFNLQSEVALLNPLSEDQEVMVPSLIPGLVQMALRNWNRHFGSDALALRYFQIRPSFALKNATQTVEASSQLETTVQEGWRVGVLLSGPRFEVGLRETLQEVDLFDLKGIVENLLGALGTRGFRIEPLNSSAPTALVQRVGSLFHPQQACQLNLLNQASGVFGRLHPRLESELQCRAPIWLAELDWSKIEEASPSVIEPRAFKRWSEFPIIERDFSLLIPGSTKSDKITQIALSVGKPLVKVARIFDIYRGQQVAEGMTSVSVRVIFSEEGRSLKESEAEEVSQKILTRWKTELGAQLRT